MNEMVQVLRAEDYFETFGRNGIGKGENKTLVRLQLIETFRKEIFGLVAMRAKKNFTDIPPEGDPEAIRIARNIIRDETKKWIKVCKLFEQYVETSGLLKYDDISMDAEDILKGKGDKGRVLGTEVTDYENYTPAAGVTDTTVVEMDIPENDGDGGTNHGDDTGASSEESDAN